METRALGKTGYSVSALGFGCGAVGGLMVKGEAAEQRRAVERAIEAGITYFDTAPSYGDGRSEDNLGRVLQELGAATTEKLVVGTKFRVDPETAGAGVAGATAAIRASAQASLRRLHLERVHLMQLHNQIAASAEASPLALTAEQVMGPVAEGMRALVEEGLAAHVGFTATGDPAAVKRIVASGAVETGQVYFNALNPSAGYAGTADKGQVDFGGLIDVAAEHGVGVINIRSLAAGAVSATAERHPNAGGAGGGSGIVGERYEDDVAKARALADLARELGLESPVELAFRFALSKAGVSTVIVGYSSEAQLEDAIRWANRGKLAEEVVRRVVALRGG